ncbi:MAG: hypothetical protein OXC40_00950 [Proteobacteria bacterium]|nr:hypothetical protein [Pseudomonadota bacterium]
MIWVHIATELLINISGRGTPQLNSRSPSLIVIWAVMITLEV